MIGLCKHRGEAEVQTQQFRGDVRVASRRWEALSLAFQGVCFMCVIQNMTILHVCHTETRTYFNGVTQRHDHISYVSYRDTTKGFMCVIQRHENTSCVSHRDMNKFHVCHKETRQYFMCVIQRHDHTSCVSYRDTNIHHVCHTDTQR